MTTTATATATATDDGAAPSLRLHVYDHCPFCIRVELVLGWSDVAYERAVYGYGDRLGDASKKEICYDGGVVLTGKKSLPVLERIDASGNREWLMGESLDIIAWVLERSRETSAAAAVVSPSPGAFPERSGREDLREFFKTDGRFKIVQRILSRPRALKQTHLTDWAREEDRAYGKAKYEAGGFDYAAAEAMDAAAKLEMAALLEEADEKLLASETSLYQSGTLGFDDLLYLPELRTVSLARGLVWPARLRGYIVSAFSMAGVGTYFDDQVD
eukprot:CAMPEP_0197175772 /NCGR_PEP_ID=MMETSP1423-20130617/1901_1 /TAXON_ID=476441 /ORGANISM="Pseudo-nitzschia heimii, Strain UNC1101" /LENGTH=271 /DNA_ID=CAMNT_0042625005 /DNA_START=20 /DNA_END=835 /DNA_ORIENTATION=+